MFGKLFGRKRRYLSLNTSEPYLIIGPDCGRDYTGKFHCVCGKCRRLPEEEGRDRCDCPYYCRNCGYDRDNKRD